MAKVPTRLWKAWQYQNAVSVKKHIDIYVSIDKCQHEIPAMYGCHVTEPPLEIVCWNQIAISCDDVKATDIGRQIVLG